MKHWKRPEGNVFTLYDDILTESNHLMIAGATGSGKSVVINGLMSTALHYMPTEMQFVLIDPKRTELIQYKQLPHTIAYASEPADMVQALEYAMRITDSRFDYMQSKRIRKYDGSHVYIVIDEFADLMLTDKKHVQPLVQRLAQIGRAARVHIILATQCPIAKVIPTEIKCNFDDRIGLRTRSAQDSRNILGVSGCECLPRYGQGYYMDAVGCTLYDIPFVSDTEINGLVEFWTKQNRVGFFRRIAKKFAR